MCKCNHHRPFPSRPYMVNRGKLMEGFLTKAPDEGWTDELLASRRGERLMRDIVKAKNLATATEAPKLAKSLKRLFNRQIEVIIESFKRRYRNRTGVVLKGTKAELILDVESYESLWAQSIEEALAEQGIVVSATVTPHLQSVADTTVSTTSKLLGLAAPTEAIRRTVQHSIYQIGERVSRINETSRRSITRLITQAVDNDLTVAETIKQATERWDEIADRRIPTIVRTEISNTIDRAQSIMYRDSGVVTHVSVVGCEAIEPNIPTFRGIPTCNIINVPVQYSGDLEFHPNHTGTIIPSRMRHSDGSVPVAQTRQGEGEGTYEERRSLRDQAR